MSKVTLKVSDLVVNYGPISALKGIDIEVKENQVVAILGANGAGKTTLLRTISGLVKSQSGSIELFDKDITKLEAEKITKAGVSQSPEGRQIFYDLSVLDNLKTGAYTLSDRKKLDENFQFVYKLFPILKERENQVAGTLSGGEQQMLAIGRALMNSPKVLLLDEPSLGLAPLIVKDILEITREIADSGVSVIIVEQNAKQTLKISDYAYVLELGRISEEGPAQELLQSTTLIEAYLGK
ncbi:MAG TPA: ABC transporter ATP-binding protein [Erysipelothrix sp.]|nr:ABC transporter ATP-binding protein [Erysipelothrix sp.]